MTIENLKLQEIIDFLKTIKKGRYHSITRKCVENNGYYTIKTYVGRFCSYASVSGKEENETQSNNNGKVTIIPNILYYYTKTDNYVLMVCTTKRQHKTKVKYFDNNGNEITKIEYEMVNPPKKSYGNVTIVFNLKLKEIIEIK